MSSKPDLPADQADTETLQRVAEHVAARDVADAICVVDRVIKEFPRDARLRFLRGSLCAEAKDYDAALKDFDGAVQLDPQLAIARFQSGLLLLCLGHADEARRVWAPLDLLKDGNCLRIFKRGLCFLMDEQLAESVAILKVGQKANRSFLPLNTDMQLLINLATSRLESSGNQPAEEGIHVLLSGYLGSTTKH